MNDSSAKNQEKSSKESSAEKSHAIDLEAPGVAKAVSRKILSEIDEYCVTAYDGGHRKHLGASLIGHSCSRYLWYVFRWCFREKHSGRQQRLFNRGHREEARFIEWLEGIGVKVWFENRDAVPNEKGEYPQYRISGALGHFGGSLDGIAVLPERYGIAEPVLLEFKTNGTGAGFSKLTSDGMAVAKPQHFCQTSTYGASEGYNFNWVLYLNICKNDDDLHVELVKLNHKLGKQMYEKAERIIFAESAPARLSDNPTYKDCSWCAAKDICHKGAIPEKNCRSCKHSKPIEGGQWFCGIHSASIPEEFISQGCASYIPVTSIAK